MNAIIQMAASSFVSDFHSLFKRDAQTTHPDTLRVIQIWFNQVHLLVSFVTAVPLEPVQFKCDGSSNDRTTLLHIHATCYVAVQHFERMQITYSR